MMRIERQIGFWIGALALLILFLWTFSGVLLPFAAAFVIAYLLDPLADRLQSLGVNRLVATLLIFAGCVTVLALILTLIVPVLIHQFAEFIRALPDLLSKLHALISIAGGKLAKDYAGPLLQRLGLSGNASDVRAGVGDLAAQAAAWTAALSELTRYAWFRADQPRLPDRRHAGRRLLHAAGLSSDDRRDRQPRSAPSSRRRAPARQRGRSGHGGLFARPVARLSVPRHLVWLGPVADRAELRLSDRHYRRLLELHPLFRFPERPRGRFDRRDRARLAALVFARHDLGRRRYRPTLRRPIFSRQSSSATGSACIRSG